MPPNHVAWVASATPSICSMSASYVDLFRATPKVLGRTLDPYQGLENLGGCLFALRECAVTAHGLVTSTSSPSARSDGPCTTTRSPPSIPAITRASSPSPGFSRNGTPLDTIAVDHEHHVGAVIASHCLSRYDYDSLASLFILFRLIFPKRDFDAHIGKNAGIELLEADANTHRGPIPIRRGDDGDDVTRDFPIRVRVQSRLDFLSRANSINVALVDVDFDFERFHIDDGTNSGTREPAPGAHG